LDEIQKTIFQFEGRRQLEELTAMLGKEAAIMADLVDKHKQGVLSSAQYAQQARVTAGAVAGYVQQIETLDQQLKAATLRPAGVSVGQRAQGIQQLGYAVQDFVSTSGGLAQKFNSVTNNIQGLAGAFVPSAWGFVAITSFMSAIQLLFNNSDAIADWFSGVDPAKLEAQAKKVKELEAKSKNLDAALERIRKAEGKDSRSAEAGDVAQVAIERAGGVDKVVKDVAQQYAGESTVISGAMKQLRDALAEQAKAGDELARIPADQMNWSRRQQAGARKDAIDKTVADLQGRIAKAQEEARVKAGEAVVAAVEGDAKAIGELAKRLPKSDMGQATREALAQQDEDDRAAMESTERTPEEKTRRSTLAARRKKKQAATKRSARLAGYQREDEANATSTPEEIAESEAMEAIQARGVGKDWTDDEWVKAAKEAVANNNSKIGGKESIDLAIGTVQAGREKRGEAAELMQYEQRANAMTNGMLPQGQVEAVARQVQGLVRDQGANPELALQGVLQELMQAYADQNARLRGLQQFGHDAAQQIRTMRQQMAPMTQTMPTLTPFGRLEAPGDAANPGADANPLAAHMREMKRREREAETAAMFDRVDWLGENMDRLRAERPRVPSLLSHGDW
jgi:hypothetical protein